jgi:beta-1,4-N-acetylglucosaminyltransferase
MIFVTVGSSSIPFDRLLSGIDAMSIDEPVMVQHGASTIRPRRAACVDFLDYDEFVDLVRRARVTITHAGVGSVMTALGERKRPIVVPRRRAYGEAVDDHQASFARRAAELGLVTLVENAELLDSAVVQHAPNGWTQDSQRSPIEVDLRAYIEECVGPQAALVSSEEGARERL